MSDPLRALFLVAEAAPFKKVGGLGDVGGSLPVALQRSGGDRLDLRVAIPHHGGMSLEGYPLTRLDDVPVRTRKGIVTADVCSLEMDGVTFYLVGGGPIRRSHAVYQADARLDSSKFTFFSLAALELTRRMGWQPDILHANDWHAAPALTALKTCFSGDAHFAGTHSILTLHNLPYMGDGSAYADYGLEVDDTGLLPAWAIKLPLPLGLLHADRIVAVSPSYARGIQGEVFGCGLQDFLRSRHKDLLGILNGLDYRLWDPDTDPYLEEPFSNRELHLRALNKTTLQAEVGLPVDAGIPLLGMVSRLDAQKGIDLAFEAVRNLRKPKCQFILVGTGDPALEDAARSLQAEFPERVWVVLRYAEGMARKVYAGSDLLLMPSRYEPCGLAQMIAMRYGSIPVGTRVGGLLDTIHDPQNDRNRTGFLADRVDVNAFTRAIRRALHQMRDTDEWRAMQKRAMRHEFSWDHSADRYLKLYRELAG